MNELSSIEKEQLFDEIESSAEVKEEFLQMQNVMAISKLGTKKGDIAWAEENKKKLFNKLDRQKRYKIYRRTLSYAAIVTLLALNIWLFVDKPETISREVLYTRIEVPKGQRIYMTFQDGTQAWLSPRSVIRIPNDFSEKERFIELDGEGFFNVTKDPERPFFVKTKKYDIKVLGTKFNVFAYSSSPRFEANLVVGSIQLMNNLNPKENLIMEPNEKVTAINGELTKSTEIFDNEDYLESGIFYFKNKKFSEILDYLNLWYNVNFNISSNINLNKPVSGKFRQSDDIERILKALQSVHFFNYKIESDKITIY